MLGRRPDLVAEDHAADGFRAVRPRCPCSGCRRKATAADGQAGWPAEHRPAAVLSRLRGREPDRIGIGRNVASLVRWLQGVRPDSAHWAPPARRRSNREIAAVVRTTPKTVA